MSPMESLALLIADLNAQLRASQDHARELGQALNDEQLGKAEFQAKTRELEAENARMRGLIEAEKLSPNAGPQ